MKYEYLLTWSICLYHHRHVDLPMMMTGRTLLAVLYWVKMFIWISISVSLYIHKGQIKPRRTKAAWDLYSRASHCIARINVFFIFCSIFIQCCSTLLGRSILQYIALWLPPTYTMYKLTNVSVSNYRAPYFIDVWRYWPAGHMANIASGPGYFIPCVHVAKDVHSIRHNDNTCNYLLSISFEVYSIHSRLLPLSLVKVLSRQWLSK